MTSKIISASVLAIAALASVSSFAESNPFPQVAQTASNTSRTQVQAELAQAQREGYSATISNTWQDTNTAPVSNRTRAEVKREAGSAVSVSAIERLYPVVQ